MDTSIIVFTKKDGKKYEKSNSFRSLPGNSKELSRGDSIRFFTTIPIKKINPDSILIILDADTLRIKEKGIKIISFPWTFIPLEHKKRIGLIFKKGSLIDVLGDTLSKKSFLFKPKLPENYGQLEGGVETDEDCYLIEVLDTKFQAVAFRENEKKFIFKGLDPGSYMIRSLIDKNCNGKWDAGNYKLKIEPEKYFFYKETLQLKANWIQQDKVLSF